MIPTIPELQTELTVSQIPNLTYKLHSDLNRLAGWSDDLESVAQSIYLILNTERYKHILYSWNYGIELIDLFGKQIPYVYSELERRITDALLVDDRIETVKDFKFETSGKIVHVTFTVTTIFGDIDAETEVNI